MGQLSYLLKEKAYMSSALLAVTVGIGEHPSQPPSLESTTYQMI